MEDKTPKQKKPVRRIKSVASAEPEGPTGGFFEEMESTCGHMACTGGKCNVRYVGPVTQVRDHHIVHASRHASHIWSAAIVSGLAVVLTGAIGYAALGAEATNPGGTLYGEFQQINQRLDKIEEGVKALLERCQTSSCNQEKPLTQAGGNQMNTSQLQQPNECVQSCNKAYPDSQEKAAACAKDRCATSGGQQTQDQCMLQCKKDNPDNADAINTCYKTKCTQQTPTQPAADQCQQQCSQKYAGLDLTDEQKNAYTKSCVERNCAPAQQTTSDQCTQGCKDKYRDDQAAINACLAENKCPGYQPAQPVADQCALNCKTKYKDDQAAINSCFVEMKCPGYENIQAAYCQGKCTSTREACVKAAGTNTTSLRTCYSKETECKRACNK